MSMPNPFRKIRNGRWLIFMCLVFLSGDGKCQPSNMYPPFTKWYQDPLGLKPIQLSTAFGFVWGSAAFATCLFLTKTNSSSQKKISVYLEGGYGFGYKPPYTNVFQNDIGLMYHVRQWMATGLSLNSFHFGDDVNNTWTTGVMPFVRWYLHQSKTTKLFFQYGAGVSYSLKRFPLTGTGWEADTGRTGTRFNFLSRYGAGMEIQFTKQLCLQYGVRHFHLSNGNIQGIKRNPSHDSNAFFAGFTYRLR
jgi:opacity protein-like surface antigen